MYLPSGHWYDPSPVMWHSVNSPYVHDMHVSSLVHLSPNIWGNCEIYGNGSKYVIITSMVMAKKFLQTDCQISVDVTGFVI